MPAFEITLQTFLLRKLFLTSIIILPSGAYSQQPCTNEQAFFNCVFKKYPEKFYPLGSTTVFSESYDSATNTLIWKLAFLIIDSSKSQDCRYLNEISYPVLKKHLPALHFYVGRHSLHPEIGGRRDFVAFLQNDTADFSFNNTTLNDQLLQILKGISISQRIEREKFSEALLSTFIPRLLYQYHRYRKINTTFRWKGNQLIVTSKYKWEEKISIKLFVSFNGDKISTVSLE